jgi:hypothetical protein
VRTTRIYHPEGKQARRENSSDTLTAAIISLSLAKLTNDCARMFLGQKERVINDPAHTDRILAQDKALVHALEALSTIKPSGPLEQTLAGLLLAAYKRRLRAIVGSAPSWVTEEILSASECTGDRRAVLGMSDN